MLRQVALVDRRQVARGVAGEAQLGRELRLATQQVGGLDQREQAGRLVPAGRRRVPLEVEGQQVEPGIGGRGVAHARILPRRAMQ